MAGPERPNMSENIPPPGQSGPDVGAQPPQEISVNQLLQVVVALQGQIAQLAGRIGRLTSVMEEAQGIGVEQPTVSPAEDPRLSQATQKMTILQQTASEISNFEAQIQAGQVLSADQQAAYNQAVNTRSTLWETASFAEVKHFRDHLDPTVPDQQRSFTEAEAVREILYKEANQLGLLNPAKIELLGIFYDSRVKVTLKEKEGREEFKTQGGILDDLQDKQTEAKGKSWEEGQLRAGIKPRRRLRPRPRFWNDANTRSIEAARGLNRGDLERRFGGIVDDFYQGSIDLIADVVEDRRRYRYGEDYPDRVLKEVWNGVNGVVVDERGRPLTDEDENVQTAQDFDDVREAIEYERKENAYVSSRGDYETWIQLVADDEEELEEMIPDVARKVVRNLGTGEINAVYQNSEEEKKKIDKALNAFPFKSAARRRRIKSALIAEINGLAGSRTSKLVRKDPGVFFHYVDFLATATEDTEDQDHLVDSWLLDRKGEVMAGLQLYAGNLPLDELLPAGLVNEELRRYLEDGGFWRYGKNTLNTHRNIDGRNNMGNFYSRQRRFRKIFERILTNIKLRSMQDLLNLDEHGVLAPGQEPKHPAFQRLKKNLDEEDEQDRQANNGNILDADGNPTTETRWQEYCRKALAWEKDGKLGDPRENPRVIFQHPLARAFRPKGFEDEGGNVTDRSEFWDMYQVDGENKRWYLTTKGRRSRHLLARGERIQQAFMIDVAAAGPRHWFDVKKDPITGQLSSTQGDIVSAPNGTQQLEITPRLRLDIKFDNDGKPYIEEIVPHIKLVRAYAQQALTEDAENVRSHGNDNSFRRFKIYHLLRNKLGIPIDSPTFAAWYIGAHDTLRAVMFKFVPEFARIYEVNRERSGVKLVDGRPDQEDSMDEKGTTVGFAEFERRFKICLNYVVRQIHNKYFNFPGHDTKDGGGKEFRNANEPAFGISSYTVKITTFIKRLLALCGDFGNDYGATGDGDSPLNQVVALCKSPDESVFRQTGFTGFVENPRDAESWSKRAKGNLSLMELLNKGDKDHPGGILNSGLLSGVYHLRTINRDPENFLSDKARTEGNYGIIYANAAYDLMKEAAYDKYVGTAAGVINPFLKLIEQVYASFESNFGRNPGSAEFAATFYWYSLSSWLDQEWAEYRGIYGYAYDAILPLSRVFMHTVLKESALIHTDQQWDEIMLGYSRVEYEDGLVERIIRYKVEERTGITAGQPGNRGHVETIYNLETKQESDGDIIKVGTLRRKDAKVTAGKTIKAVETHEGILDAFPKKLRDEIIRRHNDPKEKEKLLPMGINSYRPETLEIMRKFKDLEGSMRTQAIYQAVAENLGLYTQPRRLVIRS